MLAPLLHRVTRTAHAALQALRRRLLAATKPTTAALLEGCSDWLARPCTHYRDSRHSPVRVVQPAQHRDGAHRPSVLRPQRAYLRRVGDPLL